MAKVAFTKLGITKNSIEIENKKIIWNEQEIEIKQYLPVQEKLELISNVVNLSLSEDTSFANPVKIEVYAALEIIFAYTNVSFTEKQKEDTPKLYDLLNKSGFIDAVCSQIPEEEYNFIFDGITESIESIYKYKNSIVGILDTISTDYSNLNLDATEIQQKLSDPNNLTLIKDILSKLG